MESKRRRAVTRWGWILAGIPAGALFLLYLLRLPRPERMSVAEYLALLFLPCLLLGYGIWATYFATFRLWRWIAPARARMPLALRAVHIVPVLAAAIPFGVLGGGVLEYRQKK